MKKQAYSVCLFVYGVKDFMCSACKIVKTKTFSTFFFVLTGTAVPFVAISYDTNHLSIGHSICSGKGPLLVIKVVI